MYVFFRSLVTRQGTSTATVLQRINSPATSLKDVSKRQPRLDEPRTVNTPPPLLPREPREARE